MIGAQPWWPEWNFRALQWLFHVIRHRGTTDTLLDFLTSNHLVSTWIFAAVFYLYWRIADERTTWRRWRLTQIVIAFAIAVVISLVIRPFVSWPAPAVNPGFRGLYPNYFWGNGSYDSFPSHATLAYFMVAAGIWPLNRRLSLALTVWVLAFISFARIYVGGHYPIDVLASLVLGVAVLLVVCRWNPSQSSLQWLVSPRNGWRELVLILWLFELAEEFRGLTNALFQLKRALGH